MDAKYATLLWSVYRQPVLNLFWAIARDDDGNPVVAMCKERQDYWLCEAQTGCNFENLVQHKVADGYEQVAEGVLLTADGKFESPASNPTVEPTLYFYGPVQLSDLASVKNRFTAVEDWDVRITGRIFDIRKDGKVVLSLSVDTDDQVRGSIVPKSAVQAVVLLGIANVLNLDVVSDIGEVSTTNVHDSMPWLSFPDFEEADALAIELELKTAPISIPKRESANAVWF